MKKLLLSLTLVAALTPSLRAETFNFGFCPEDATEEQMTAHGSGKNIVLEAMIRLSPAEMPQVAALKGAKIIGVRAKLRNDIERKGSILARIGSTDAEPIKKDCWLMEGWNTVKFAEPITIGDEDIYLGYRANETQGASGHHPILAAVEPAPSSTYFVNLNLTGWQEMGHKGSVMIQAIIDGDPSVLSAPDAVVAVYGFPKLVAPSAPFNAMVNVKNLSSEPIHNLTIDYVHGSIDLEAEIAPFATAQIPVTLMTDAVEATDVPFVTHVSRVNGTEIDGYKSTAHLYVVHDAFIRIPLIEEWTGQTCVNCPFMAYYLDMAREEAEVPHTYVAHHAGFEYDKMTQQVDRDLLFLFGSPSNQRNPAIMYDRSYLPGETEIIFGAREPSPEEYLKRILAAEDIPALAEVNVDVADKDVTVSGKVSTGSKTADGKVFLSAYLIEDDIKPTPQYLPQRGINVDVADDAPADLVDKFRHNGVIRANLTEISTGDKLEFDSDGTYEVHFTLPELKQDWNAKNLHVVAFIHRFDPSDLKDNYVLNSGDSKGLGEVSIRELGASVKTLRAVRGTDGSIVVLSPVSSVEAFDVAGRRIDLNRPAPAGLVIVRAKLPDGTVAIAKLL